MRITSTETAAQTLSGKSVAHKAKRAKEGLFILISLWLYVYIICCPYTCITSCMLMKKWLRLSQVRSFLWNWNSMGQRIGWPSAILSQWVQFTMWVPAPQFYIALRAVVVLAMKSCSRAFQTLRRYSKWINPGVNLNKPFEMQDIQQVCILGVKRQQGFPTAQLKIDLRVRKIVSSERAAPIFCTLKKWEFVLSSLTLKIVCPEGLRITSRSSQVLFLKRPQKFILWPSWSEPQHSMNSRISVLWPGGGSIWKQRGASSICQRVNACVGKRLIF